MAISIDAKNLTKEYNYRTVFRNLSLSVRSGESIAVLGSNGSGKSTLLKILSGITGSTSGEIEWLEDDQTVPDYKWYEYLTFCSPYFDFDSRFTVLETLKMFSRGKAFSDQLNPEILIHLMGFQKHAEKKMNELSSGMYQRVRLILTICADVPVLFLDEPCSNLDQAGVDWYNELIETYAAGKLIFVASNDPREYRFCGRTIHLSDFKENQFNDLKF